MAFGKDVALLHGVFCSGSTGYRLSNQHHKDQVYMGGWA